MPFEQYLLQVAAQCQPAFGGMGAVGFLYESAKDQIRWHRLNVRRYISLIMAVGSLLFASKEEWQRKSPGTNIESASAEEIDEFIRKADNGKHRNGGN